MDKNYKPYEVDVNTIGFYVDRLLFAMIKSRNQDLKEINSDLQHAEFVVVKILSFLKEATQMQLANVMGKERSGVSRILASLESKGYIERKPLNGSTNSVTLTQKGLDTLPMITALSEKLEERAFKGFSEKKRADLLKSLHKVYNNVLSDIR